MTTWLSIDPGSTESAFVVWDGEAIIAHGKKPNEEVLARVRLKQEGRLAIEMLHAPMTAGKEIYMTCLWMGRFVEAWGEKPYALINRSSIRRHLLGKVTGNDSLIRQAVIDRFGGSSALAKARKCPRCKGKGDTMLPRMSDAGKTYKVLSVCPDCEGSSYVGTNGPLVGITADRWAALAVALCAADTCADGKET